MDKRVTMLNQAWGMPEYNHFGTDEFLRFCERIGAQPQIALNLGSGTAGSGADWVRYVNQHWGGGTAACSGNSATNFGARSRSAIPRWSAWPSAPGLSATAVRAADPRARLIATGADPDHFRDWNAAQLALPAGTFQFLSTHFVVGDGDVRQAPTRRPSSCSRRRSPCRSAWSGGCAK